MAQVVTTQLDHSLTTTKGWFDMAALDLTVKLSPAVTFSLPQGRVIHIDTAPAQANGLRPKDIFAKTGATGTQMPMYVLRGGADYDVSNPGTTSTGRFMHVPIAPANYLTALVATGAYELETTEFDQAQTYLPNQFLTAGQADTNAATGGLITNQGTGAGNRVKQFVDCICGIVCRGAYYNNDQAKVLNLWTYFLPGAFV